MMFKAALGLAAGATLFLGYCYYFDAKRRSDPFYKQKVKERKYLSPTQLLSLCLVKPKRKLTKSDH